MPEAVQFQITGRVQGVGFRPFLQRLAMREGWIGRVRNDNHGVELTLSLQGLVVDSIADLIRDHAPPASRIETITHCFLAETVLFTGFHIEKSDSVGALTTLPPPDLAPCSQCREELMDPGNHRYLHPFISCTDCGPRLSIITDMPYDRSSTTMDGFAMCPRCHGEYTDPLGRRFHAQPIACPDCGPRLSFSVWTRGFEVSGSPIEQAVALLEQGGILALKGVGGYQLLVDATDDAAVLRLRERKHRDSKPFALMVWGLEEALELVEFSEESKTLFCSPESPIICAPARQGHGIAASVAPDTNLLGVMGPASPLHFLLAQAHKGPVVATSGNRSGEPMVISSQKAKETLGSIADAVLEHDRPIVRAVDDSVYTQNPGTLVPIRLGRGVSPLKLDVSRLRSGGMAAGGNLVALALGGHLKNAPALGVMNEIIQWPHVGDLDSVASVEAHRRACDDLQTFLRQNAEIIIRDRHPDYRTIGPSNDQQGRVVTVQHHLAHGWACAAEHNLKPPFTCVVADGIGFAHNNRAWGAEVIAVENDGWSHCGGLTPVAMPAHDAAAKEPSRSLGAYAAADQSLAERCSQWSSKIQQAELLNQSGINVSYSGAGRLIDAAACLLGIAPQRNGHESHSALALQALAAQSIAPAEIEFPVSKGLIDWRPALASLAEGGNEPDLARGFFLEFGRSLVQAIPDERVTLPLVASGGCLANPFIAEGVRTMAAERGLEVFFHRQLPPGDGCLAVGQIAAWLGGHSDPMF